MPGAKMLRMQATQRASKAQAAACGVEKDPTARPEPKSAGNPID